MKKILFTTIVILGIQTYLFGQEWRKDGAVEVVADSIEYILIEQRNHNLKIKITNEPFQNIMKVKWLNDTIVKTMCKGKNTWKAQSSCYNGRKSSYYLLVRNNEVCVLEPDKQTVLYCPQDYKEGWDYKSDIQRQLSHLDFKYDKKGRLVEIVESGHEENTTYKIKY